MTPRERELLQGMANCYSACHADFEETVSMVSSSRGLSTLETKAMLKKIAQENGSDEEYRALRSRVPEEFPF